MHIGVMPALRRFRDRFPTRRYEVRAVEIARLWDGEPQPVPAHRPLMFRHWTVRAANSRAKLVRQMGFEGGIRPEVGRNGWPVTYHRERSAYGVQVIDLRTGVVLSSRTI